MSKKLLNMEEQMKEIQTKWNIATKWEKSWWGNCTNTLNEEIKQIVYAQKMGLNFVSTPKTPYNILLNNLSVVDVGGGPCSILLKSLAGKNLTVIDPCLYPKWVMDRYSSHNIAFLNMMGEDSNAIKDVVDEVWIYNVLQHTKEPCTIAQNMRKWSKIMRVFEWIDTKVNEGHPHSLSSTALNEWFGGIGKVETLNENGCFGKCWFGIFKGDNY